MDPLGGQSAYLSFVICHLSFARASGEPGYFPETLNILDVYMSRERGAGA